LQTTLYVIFRNSNVKFVHANKIDHILPRTFTSLISFHVFIDVSTCLLQIIVNKMLYLSHVKKEFNKIN